MITNTYRCDGCKQELKTDGIAPYGWLSGSFSLYERPSNHMNFPEHAFSGYRINQIIHVCESCSKKITDLFSFLKDK